MSAGEAVAFMFCILALLFSTVCAFLWFLVLPVVGLLYCLGWI